MEPLLTPFCFCVPPLRSATAPVRLGLARFGQFLEKLGEGNSSVVHRAHDRRLNRDFAIKRIQIYDKSKRHQIIKELHTLYKVRRRQTEGIADGSLSTAAG